MAAEPGVCGENQAFGSRNKIPDFCAVFCKDVIDITGIIYIKPVWV